MTIDSLANNQVVVKDDEGTRYFVSYGTFIVRIKNGKVSLDERYWDYSRTTIKYRNLFLGEDSKQVNKKVENGTYELVKLN